MFKIKGTNGLYITNRLDIIDKLGIDEYKLLANNKIEIEIYGCKVTLELINLYRIMKSSMYIEHKSIYSNLSSFYYVKNNKKYLDKTVIKRWCLLKHPITIKHSNGNVFRVISINTRYAIDVNGVIWDLLEDKLRYTRTVVEGYPNIKLARYNGIQSSRMLHRLKAIAWIPNDDYINKNIVNHIDGDKNNHNLSNLEWVSSRYNNQHASMIGLRTDNRPVRIRNIDTLEVLEFHSLSAATAYIGRSKVTTTSTDVVGTGKVLRGLKGRFEIKYQTDNSPWVSDVNIGIIDGVNQKNRMYIYLDGAVSIINNNDDLVSFISSNIKDADLSRYATKNTFIRNAKRFEKEYSSETMTVDIVELGGQNKNHTYICRNTKTKEEVKAITRKDIMDVTGGTKSAIQKSIATNGAYAVNEIWYVKYDDGKDFAEPAVILNRKRVVIAKHPNGDVITFDSVREASYHFNIDKKSVSRMLGTTRTILGYSFVTREE